MMAEAPDLFSEQELTCSICLDLFDEPVSTPCGHNFCQVCIGGYWASSSLCTCPLCKREFEERPQLSVNKVFALIADKYKVGHYGAAGPPVLLGNGTPVLPGAKAMPPGGDSTEVVWCDVCTGGKQPAVSSCLTCTASYCREHLQPHLSSSFYSKHPLMEPLEALRGRTCRTHRRLMEVYCRTCQRCICAICVLEEHRTHKTVSVQTERLGKQKHVARTEQEILNRIREKELHVTELKRKLETVKSYAEGERGEVDQLLDHLSSALDRVRTQVSGGIQNQLDTVMSQGEGLVRRLEAELSQLTDRRVTLEDQAVSQDHILFLQSYEQATAPLGEEQRAEEEPDLFLHFQLGEVKSSLLEVKEKMEDIRMGEARMGEARMGEARMGEARPRGSGSAGELATAESLPGLRGSSAGLRKSQWSLKDLKKMKPVSGHKKARVYMEDVTLNPVTAYPFLILSEDRKQVKRGEKLQFYRNSQQRFDVWSCISGKESFSTGRHYWEVSVGESKDWKLGVVSESAPRKGLFDMSPSNGYYAIWWSNSTLRALTAPPLTKVKSPQKLRQVGVFLDVDEGQVSFFNVKTSSEIYSFSGEFSDRMFPLLGTGDKEVPLVLMSTQPT